MFTVYKSAIESVMLIAVVLQKSTACSVPPFSIAFATLESNVFCACMAILSASFVIAFSSTAAFTSTISALSSFLTFSLQENRKRLQIAIIHRVIGFERIIINKVFVFYKLRVFQ